MVRERARGAHLPGWRAFPDVLVKGEIDHARLDLRRDARSQQAALPAP